MKVVESCSKMFIIFLWITGIFFCLTLQKARACLGAGQWSSSECTDCTAYIFSHWADLEKGTFPQIILCWKGGKTLFSLPYNSSRWFQRNRTLGNILLHYQAQAAVEIFQKFLLYHDFSNDSNSLKIQKWFDIKTFSTGSCRDLFNWLCG